MSNTIRGFAFDPETQVAVVWLPDEEAYLQSCDTVDNWFFVSIHWESALQFVSAKHTCQVLDWLESQSIPFELKRVGVLS